MSLRPNHQPDPPLRQSFSAQYLNEARQIIDQIDVNAIEHMARLLSKIRATGGRLFFLGVGGSAGNCSHAVNDFRKIVGIEAYAPTDNVSELTARTNDEGWETVFVEWLKVSQLHRDDAIFVFSVGGGNLEKNVSPNLVRALQYAKEIGSKILGVVGRDGGYTAKVGDAVCIIPTVNPDAVTPTPRRSRPSSGICSSLIRLLRHGRPNGKGSAERERPGKGSVPGPRWRLERSGGPRRQAVFADDLAEVVITSRVPRCTLLLSGKMGSAWL